MQIGKGHIELYVGERHFKIRHCIVSIFNIFYSVSVEISAEQKPVPKHTAFFKQR